MNHTVVTSAKAFDVDLRRYVQDGWLVWQPLDGLLAHTPAISGPSQVIQQRHNHPSLDCFSSSCYTIIEFFHFSICILSTSL